VNNGSYARRGWRARIRRKDTLEPDRGKVLLCPDIFLSSDTSRQQNGRRTGNGERILSRAPPFGSARLAKSKRFGQVACLRSGGWINCFDRPGSIHTRGGRANLPIGSRNARSIPSRGSRWRRLTR